MSDVEKLKQLDPEKVCERLYITPRIFQYLVEKRFKELGNRTKVLGLISILEREYELDLSELRDSANKYFLPDEVTDIIEKERLEFEEATKRKSFNGTKIFILLLLFGVAFLLYRNYENDIRTLLRAVVAQGESMPQMEQKENSSDISGGVFESSLKSSSSQAGMREITSKSVDSKESKSSLKVFAASSSQPSELEENKSKENEESILAETNRSEINQTTLEEQTKEIVIIPKKKIWIGVIYLDNFKHKQTLTDQPFEINASKDLLIVTGHGLFRIEHDGEIDEYNSTKKQRFIYRAGTLEKIDAKTFRRYNRGKDW